MRAPTSVTLSATPDPATGGNRVVVTAAMTPPSATGNVQFFDGTVSLGTVSLVNGFGSISVPTFAAGRHPLKAVYSGDGLNMANSSAPFSLSVQ